MISAIKKELREQIDPEKAAFYPTFFKAGKGEYAQGDKFLGITVPNQRKIAKRYTALTLHDLKKLLHSAWHEERLTALFILVAKYKKAQDKKEIVNFYLDNLEGVNNWDLVDSSAHHILGEYLTQTQSITILKKLAKSKNLWERRIAIVATFAFIKKDMHEPTITIANMLVQDKHDLIHKAVGWMLREMGKMNKSLLLEFLNEHAKTMPRTMLRYAIERLEEKKRKYYLMLYRA